MSTAIRVDEPTHRTLLELSREYDESMASLAAQAVRDLRRKKFMETVNAGYAALRADESAWEAEKKERSVWDAALPDGLEK